ncbi:hypothetical protein C3Y92_12225 [Solidesulfovibrio carbinolicus]|uniref:DUF4136 domain-containing protein n=2 Tax=Solidesulfovibrio carbinolicus TaxID=296842 RepID=A0A4P6HLQ9_9BACT|nr:hypothetical protein C3Y92_12225 [Solidesulfovibrio carbinolicus]
MKMIWTLLLLAVLAGGCARTTTTSLVAGKQADRNQGLGKTVVLTWFEFEATDKAGNDKAARLRGFIEKRIGGLPGTELAQAGALTAALGSDNWRDASDMELTAAARCVGADSVALVEVAVCRGALNVNLPLPPYWNVETAFAYRVRLLDVRSGSLILSAMRAHEADRPFAMRGRETLYQEFEKDLAELIQPLAQQAAN